MTTFNWLYISALVKLSSDQLLKQDLYLLWTKFKLVSCVRQIGNGIYRDHSTWQFFNFNDKTDRAVVRGWICLKIDKVELQNQLKIVFWHAKLALSYYLLQKNSYSLTI